MDLGVSARVYKLTLKFVPRKKPTDFNDFRKVLKHFWYNLQPEFITSREIHKRQKRKKEEEE